jgi:DNA invertase Pin-like site-specific DNA recombinase
MRPRLNVLELERVSTNKQDLERQEYDLADNRAEYNLNPLQKFSIKESGEKVLKSEDIARLREELKKPAVDGVSVSAIDRFARPQDMISWAFFQVFIDLKKVIVSKREGLIEPWTPRGRKALWAALMQAGNELSDLKDRLQSNRRKQHAQKKPMNTDAPYGVIYVDKYSRDSEGKSQYYKEDFSPVLWAPGKTPIGGLTRRGVVEMVFRWRYADRMKSRAIATRLNKMGILSPGKKYKDGRWQYEPGLWQRHAVIHLLQNRHYIGEHWEGGKQVDVACPQFIDRDVFDAVKKSFAENKQDRSGRPPTQSVLSEFLRCGLCKHKLYMDQRDRKRKPIYRCVNYDERQLKRRCSLKSILCAKIDAAVFHTIWQHLTQPELLLANARAYYESLPTRGASAKLEKELVEMRGQIERTQEMVRLGTYDKDKGNTKILEDMKRVREIEADLGAAGSVVNLPAQRVIEAACRQIAEGPEPGDFETRRPVLEKLIDLRIFYADNEFEVTAKVPVALTAAKHGGKCSGSQYGHYTSTLYIPLQIKGRVAA